MIISVSKDFELERNDIGFVDRSDLIRKDWNENPEAILEESPEFNDKLCVLYEQEIEEEDFPYVSFLTSMMSDGLKSPLYQEVREKRGLSYSVSNSIMAIGDKLVNYIFVPTGRDKEEELEEAIKQVLDNPSVITEERFDIVKTSSMIKIEDGEIDRYKNIGDVLNPRIKNYKELIPKIELDKVLEVYNKYYSLDKFKKFTDK
jgi:predicted Zn-dependent peptidase